MKKELWIIFSVVFLGLLGFGIVIPTLPFIAEGFGASGTQVGIILASYSLFQFIGSPILGRLSDRFGRKPILTLSLLGSAAGFFLMAFANSLIILLFSRIIDGITGGNISVAQAYIADITKGEERTKGMGIIGAAFGLGFVFGPILGGLLSVYGFAVPYIFAGILAIIDALLIVLILPESEKKSVQKRTYGHMFDPRTLKEIFKPISVLYLTLLFFSVTFSFSLMQGVFALYSERLFGWSELENGYLFSVVGITSVITQLFIIRILTDKFSDVSLIKLSLPVLALSLGFFGLINSEIFYYVLAVFLALGLGIFNTTIQAAISKQSEDEEQGLVLGTAQGLNALARAIGPVVGGFLFTNISINSPFIFSSILLVVIFTFVSYKSSLL